LHSITKRKHAGGSRDKPPRKPKHAGKEDRCSDGVETGEECESQQGLHRYSINKRKTKDRVSSLLMNRNGDEVTKSTEKQEVLIAFFALVFTGKISSQVSHTPEARF